MEQDLLVEYSSRFMHFYNQNKAAVIGGGIGIVLVIGLVIGYFVYSNQQEQEAQALLGIAERAFAEGDYETALYGNEEEFTLGFSQIANNYSGTDAGNLSWYYAAVSEFELGNYEAALDYFNRFDVPEGVLGVSPTSFHAVILAELGRYADAAEKFEEAARWDENESTTPYNLYEAAEAHLEAGNRDRALEHVETILNDYSSSGQADKARRLKGLLAAQN